MSIPRFTDIALGGAAPADAATQFEALTESAGQSAGWQTPVQPRAVSVIDNALMWFREFHVDGLRLDAIHALVDSSEIHVLEELAVEVSKLGAHLSRPLSLVAESNLNDAALVLPREAGGYGLDAQWNDDFHHALHVALTGDTSGYYADFGPLRSLAKV